MDKLELRQQMLQIRLQQKSAGALFVAQFLQGGFDIEDKTIAAYIPTKGEVDTRPLMEAVAAQANLCLPVCIAADKAMIFRHYTLSMDLIKDREGMACPPESSALCVPDILFVPVVAFDKNGTRLGRGGGYYDRTLAALSAPLTIGLAYDAQRLEACPKDKDDYSLDYVITQSQIYDCR